MAKKYNLGSKSDMRKFIKDLEGAVSADLKSQAMKSSYDVVCPECGRAFQATPDNNTCPNCREVVEFKLTFDL